MGKHELIEAFVRGDIDRRQFVGRLTMLGVSGGAALTYATRLSGDAAAAPAGVATGFKMRMQGADDPDYGTAIVIEVIEALRLTLAAIETRILAVLENLDQFLPGDFADRVYERLQTIFEQQQQHLDAIQALLEARTGATMGQSLARAAQTIDIDSPEDLLTTLSENLDELTSLYAAVVPAVRDGEVRQTLMEIASVASRHAALVAEFADRDSLPSAFQSPNVPDDL